MSRCIVRKGHEFKKAEMSQRRVWPRVLATLVVALAGLLALPAAARADWSVVGEKLPGGQVIDNDVVATGTDVVIDGAINGDLIAVGSTVTVNGPVTGSVLAVGNSVLLNGKVGGSAYAGGRTVTLGEAAIVQRDAHTVGLLLEGRPGSEIKHDLAAVSARGLVSSKVGRALNSFILMLTFNGQIGGEGQSASGLLAGPGGILIGLRTGSGPGYAAPGLFIRAADLGLSGLVQQPEDAAEEQAAVLPGWLAARLNDLLIMLVLGGLAVWLRPATVQRPAEWLRRKPLPSLGYGLVVAILALNAVAAAILLAVLLLVGGIWLGVVTLWAVTLVLWCIGFPALILGLALLALTIMYGTKVIVADLVGTLIFKKLAPSVLEYRIVPLLLGLVLYVVLRAIPILGWVIEGIVTLLGLGAIWLAVRYRRPVPEAVEVVEQVRPALALEA